MAPAIDAVEGTPKTVADPTDVTADPQDQDSADATETDAPKTGTQDVKSGRQDSVKDTVKKSSIGDRIGTRPQREEAGRARFGQLTAPNQAGRLRR